MPKPEPALALASMSASAPRVIAVSQAHAVDRLPPGWLRPVFSSSRVGALMTSRHGGVSPAPFDSLNLRPSLGDDDAAVATNRARVATWCGGPGVLLQQVHGTVCLTLPDASLPPMPRADASCTVTPGVVCEIQVADCLPVLLADRHGRGVAVAHAGWRGLAGGVIQSALAALCAASGAAPGEVQAWLGPCIGPRRFEVGADVVSACADAPSTCFVARPASELPAGSPPKWLADLPGLARQVLIAAGVTHVDGNNGSAPWCTVENADYFSYRREQGRTGRQAGYVWLRD
jgi:YfiH family protein